MQLNDKQWAIYRDCADYQQHIEANMENQWGRTDKQI